MSRITAILVGITIVLVSAGPATAAERGRADQCVVHVVDQLASGELIVSDPECYSSFAVAMQAEGATAAASFVIGYHYDGAGFSGASTTVMGTNCSGGWLNLSAAWNNRISSTKSGCPRIRHFNGANLTGSSETTLSPGGNLTALNNASTSIQYLT
jgi:hypothetical protein